MWHEARKQEKLIKSKMVDTAKRSERRRRYYENVRDDPDQYMQIHGRKCTIHVDANVAKSAGNVLRKWQGDPSILIDRFDARAHLDHIPENACSKASLSQDEEVEEIQCDFERYRVLVMNQFQGVTDTDFLNNIAAKEFFEDSSSKPNNQKDKKKKKRDNTAAIGYQYGDSETVAGSSKKEVDSESDDDQEFWADLEPHIDVTTLAADRAIELSRLGRGFGHLGFVFLDLLRIDNKEQTEQAELKELDRAKNKLSGKNAKLERSRLKTRRAMLIGKFNQNEEAAKTVLGLLQRHKESGDGDSSSESDPEPEPKQSVVIGGAEQSSSFSSSTSRQVPFFAKVDEDDEDRQKLFALKRRCSQSPDFSDPEEGRCQQQNEHHSPEHSESDAKDDDDDADDEPLEIRSSMSESEQERREIENRKRRIQRTKRRVKEKESRGGDNGIGDRKVDVAERLRRQMERKLNKRTKELKAEDRIKAKEREMIQRERDELLSEEARSLRQREREKQRELDGFQWRHRSRSRSSSRDRRSRGRRRSRSRERRRSAERRLSRERPSHRDSHRRSRSRERRRSRSGEPRRH